MTRLVRERLYALLPTIYKMRDFAQGEPLRALLGVLEEELGLVEDDVARLYDNWFVETADEWAIPYIGDLLNARYIRGFSGRAFVANTLAYRRRKGTLQMLGTLARDVTGWPAIAVEYRSMVAMAQHVNNPQPALLQVPNVRKADDAELIGSPFDKATRTFDVRARGRYQLDQVGVYVWRMGVFPLERVRAVEAAPGRYYLNPLGIQDQLWAPARTRPGREMVTDVRVAPQPLRRLALYRLLEARRQAAADGQTAQDPYFGRDPVLELFVSYDGGAPQRVQPEELVVADLSVWSSPPSSLSYTRRGDGQVVQQAIKAAIDPERGLLAFPDGVTPTKVWTSYYYGFGGEIGGGGYDRTVTPTPDGAKVVTVSGGDPLGLLGRLGNPAAADSLWQGSNGQLVVELQDSDTYDLGPLAIPPGGGLILRSRSGQRPLLRPTDVSGIWTILMQDHTQITLDGLLLAGGLMISGPRERTGPVVVSLRHSTLVPGLTLLPDGRPASPGTSSVASLFDRMNYVTVDLQRSISGGIDLTQAQPGIVQATDSIIDACSRGGETIFTAQASFTRTTILGPVNVPLIHDTKDTLFYGRVFSPGLPQSGISYSYLAQGSIVGLPGYRCQPALAMSVPGADGWRILAELRPWFVSVRYGTPGYAMLDHRCHPAIRSGASVEGEFGAFNSLQQAQREQNLLDSQAEYLRFGLTLNLFRVT